MLETLTLPQSAIDYANFHVYDPKGLRAWHDKMDSPIEFGLCAWVIGEKSVEAVLKHLGNFYALLTALQQEGYTLQGIVLKGGTFRLVKPESPLPQEEEIVLNEEEEDDHGDET